MSKRRVFSDNWLSRKKAEEWLRGHGYFITGLVFTSVFASVFSGLSVWGIDCLNKKAEQREREVQRQKQEYKQEIIREALDAFKQEQAKTTNFKDSVNTKQR